jgi:cell division protein FtsN
MQLHSQRGGTFLGFIIGLVLGLGVALAVAIYVTKVPTPFSNKNQPRSSAQDVQESEKNKDWNPNSVLQPKAPAEPPTPADASAAATTPQAADKVTSPPRPAVTADPLVDLAKAKSGLNTPAAPADASDPFDYVVQVGAYRTGADADAQKAKLALWGWTPRFLSGIKPDAWFTAYVWGLSVTKTSLSAFAPSSKATASTTPWFACSAKPPNLHPGVHRLQEFK